MKASRPLTTRTVDCAPPPSRLFIRACDFVPTVKGASKFPVTMTSATGSTTLFFPVTAKASSSPTVKPNSPNKVEAMEEDIEKVIYRCRFMALLGVIGSLVGSILCFIKGCSYVAASFMEYFGNRGKTIMLLVEAIDVYLLGTVMLVFGMGIYELFVSNLDIAKSSSAETVPYRSNLFGLFPLKERPRWLQIKSVSELKTKLGHVIVMLLLIGWFEKSKKALINSPLDLLCFSTSIFLSSACLFLLSKLNGSN